MSHHWKIAWWRLNLKVLLRHHTLGVASGPGSPVELAPAGSLPADAPPGVGAPIDDGGEKICHQWTLEPWKCSAKAMV